LVTQVALDDPKKKPHSGNSPFQRLADLAARGGVSLVAADNDILAAVMVRLWGKS
jgi:hypothetical protein